MNQHFASTPWLVARGHRFNGLQRVDLFWGGSNADGFDVYRDGDCIATVAASPYHDRLDRDGSDSYRYSVRETATAARSNEAEVTFGDQGKRSATPQRRPDRALAERAHARRTPASAARDAENEAARAASTSTATTSGALMPTFADSNTACVVHTRSRKGR